MLYFTYNRTDLLYHNLEHTKRVVQHSRQMADHYRLEEEDRFILLAAAWFHDTGQLKGDVAIHEETSVTFMESFFQVKHVNTSITHQVATCILATKMPVDPHSLLEKIICDADTWHLGTADFQSTDALVWQELELRLKQSIEKKEGKSLEFLETHRFYTDYCIEHLSAGKQENINQLKQRV